MTADDWYDRSPDVRQLYQGDIIDGVPLVISPPKSKRWVLLRPLPTGPVESAFAGLPRSFRANVDSGFPSAWSRTEGELVMTNAYVQPTMILSQSCNIDWRKHVQICPVYRATEVRPADLNNLRANDIGYWFYLPSDGPHEPTNAAFEECYADVSLATTVSASYLRPDALIRRLTSRAMFELQNSLADYFARPFGFNTNDEVKQKAVYRCVACFLDGKIVIPIKEIDVGGQFPPCPTCGTSALWIKIRE
jgi:hypothetical protein